MLEGNERLSPREREVLELLALGHTNQMIALALHVREATVKGYVHSVYTKLDVGNRAQATAWWLRYGGGRT